MSGPIVWPNVGASSSGQVGSSEDTKPRSLGLVVAEAPPDNDCLFLVVFSLLNPLSFIACCVLSDRMEPSWSSFLAGTTSAVSTTCSWLSRCSDQVHARKHTRSSDVGGDMFQRRSLFTYVGAV